MGRLSPTTFDAGGVPGGVSVSPLSTGLRSRCPRCGRGRLFRGFLTVVERCEACGLDLQSEDAGDGPAVFIILLVGFVVVGLVLWTEVAFSPPLWVHGVLWLPLIVILSIGLLRPFKATMIALHYRHRPFGGADDRDDGA